MLFERKQVVLAKIEAEAGTGETPDGTDAVKCDIVDVTVDGKSLTDLAVRNSIRAAPRRFVNKVVDATIRVALKGSGAAGTPSEISPLLQSCALKETISAGTSVAYSPTSDATEMKTCTLWIFKDGLCVKAAGCMSELSLAHVAGEYSVLTFSVKGKFTSAGDVENPTPTYDVVDPIEVKAGGFEFGAYDAAVMRDFNFSTTNKLVARPNVNAADGLEPYTVPERDPQFSATIEAVLEATNSFWADFIARDTVELAFAHGSVAGNIVEFAAPAANYDPPKFAGEESILMYNLSGQLLESVGDDDFTLTFK